MAEERFLDGPFGKIWVGVLGGGAPGTPLLALHGGPGFMSLTEGFELLARERPVFFYDQLGCGRSAPQSDPALFTFDNHLAELEAVIAALGLETFHLLGQSWGSTLAVAHILRPSSAKPARLVLSGPCLSAPRWTADQRRDLEAMPPETRAVIEAAERSGDFGQAYKDAMERHYHEHVCRLSPWPTCLLDALDKLNIAIYTTMWGQSEFSVTGNLKEVDLTPRLGEVDIPTLLVCGEHDEAKMETVKAYRDGFQNAQMAVIPGASHIHQLERPALFQAIVGEFLA